MTARHGCDTGLQRFGLCCVVNDLVEMLRQDGDSLGLDDHLDLLWGKIVVQRHAKRFEDDDSLRVR